jgi:hypothetical protein
VTHHKTVEFHRTSFSYAHGQPRSPPHAAAEMISRTHLRRQALHALDTWLSRRLADLSLSPRSEGPGTPPSSTPRILLLGFDELMVVCPILIPPDRGIEKGWQWAMRCDTMRCVVMEMEGSLGYKGRGRGGGGRFRISSGQTKAGQPGTDKDNNQMWHSGAAQAEQARHLNLLVLYISCHLSSAGDHCGPKRGCNVYRKTQTVHHSVTYETSITQKSTLARSAILPLASHPHP